MEWDKYKPGDYVRLVGGSARGHAGKMAVIHSVHTAHSALGAQNVQSLGAIYNLTWDEDGTPGTKYAVWEAHIEPVRLGDVWQKTSVYGKVTTGPLAVGDCGCCTYMVKSVDGETAFIDESVVTRGDVRFVSAAPVAEKVEGGAMEDTWTAPDGTVVRRNHYVTIKVGPTSRYTGRLAVLPGDTVDGERFRYLGLDILGRLGGGPKGEWCISADEIQSIEEIDLNTLAETAAAARTVADDQRTEVTRLRGLLESARSLHRQDIALIGERLISEADDRGWCEIYDEVVNELNDSLNVELPTRERDYTVTFTVTHTVTVTARNEDDAIERVRDYPSNWSSIGDGEVDDSSFEAEEE